MATTDELFQQIMRARNRVYQLCGPAPQETYALPGGGQLLLKREDLSPIHTFKWRGAYNMMAAQPENLTEGVVTASVGNHARGVALAAARLKCRARIFMPTSVGRTKTQEMTRLGEGFVEVVAAGDTYDQSHAAAHADADERGCLFIPAYDDLLLMAGEGTIGDEMMMHSLKPDVVFIQIGGGSLAAAMACAIKAHSPDIRIIGVEAKGQECMKAAVDSGHPVALPYADVFCDATAATRAGDISFEYCREYIDEFMVVGNDDVCAAIQYIWETARAMVEPAGALGLAGYLSRRQEFEGQNIGAVLTGANMDFSRLSWIAGRSVVGLHQKRYYEIQVPERAGTVLELLRTITRLNLNIEDFMYGKSHEYEAAPILSFAGTEEKLLELEARMKSYGYTFSDVSTREDVLFHIVNHDPNLFDRLYLAQLEFPERPGALLEFLSQASHWSNICYFNYSNRGEQVGRALIGFEFESEAFRSDFLRYLKAKVPYCTPVDRKIICGGCELVD